MIFYYTNLYSSKGEVAQMGKWECTQNFELKN
jgi:hypothetical protein